MTISYNWLSKYLPVKVTPERLSQILTSIGLEVEHMAPYESIRGGLSGLVIGEVVDVTKHPNADKLQITSVNTGGTAPLQIVCGASNVAAGQKVVIAPEGATIYPTTGEPLTMKAMKIRGVESQGMICAEDEIGIGKSHDGILVLPEELVPGSAAANYFEPVEDQVFEIGLTPNRMDAMSHLGVAKDVCAYLTHHDKITLKVISPFKQDFQPDNHQLEFDVFIEDTVACQRYAGVSLQGVTIAPSPKWLQQSLESIGLRPINNIVDITNFILHETGQPLHAFDAAAVTGNKVIIKKLPDGTPFTTLDEKPRLLSAQDLMICNASAPMCIAGVFGGFTSGVKNDTRDIFLESAWFNPQDIRKTSFRHNLRTDAASRFEKGVDISATVQVLKRAALLIKEIAGGTISSSIIDIYPSPREMTSVTLNYKYLKKISGKYYEPQYVANILEALGFVIVNNDAVEIIVKVPFSKTDISLPADIVEEILRIDGYDNIGMPASITMTPAVEDNAKAAYKEKISGYLTGAGFSEIMTNSITNSAYFSEDTLRTTVRMLNSLSADLDVMRPSMLETGLQSVAYNLNRRNPNLRFFEFGKTYHTSGAGVYTEYNHLCLYATGNISEDSWRSKSGKADFYFLKGITAAIFQLMGTSAPVLAPLHTDALQLAVSGTVNGSTVLEIGLVSPRLLARFDVKQPVIFADLFWDVIADPALIHDEIFTELPKQLPVTRDLSIVVSKTLPFEAVEQAVNKLNNPKLVGLQLFDVFESDKLGNDKKSMAVSFTFLDKEKTMNDKEIDSMMGAIMSSFENEIHAEIRK